MEAVFLSSSPVIRKQRQLKKTDSELRFLQPVIYKNGLVQPNFAEAVYKLYIHTKPLDHIFSATINSDDIKRNDRFFDQLVITGYSLQDQELLDSLSYEKRKTSVHGASGNPAKEFESQRRTMDKLIHQLEKPEFVKIDDVLAQLRHLADFCRFDFISLLQTFDHAFDRQNPAYAPVYQAVPPKILEQKLLDFYFLSGNLNISTSLANAVQALVQMKEAGAVNAKRQDEVLQHLRISASILKNVLTSEALRKLIILAKEEPSISLQLAVYKGTACQKFSAHVREYFEVDERRIKLEIRDETMSSELKELFGQRPLEQLNGYNNEMNTELQRNSSASFVWITGLQILKSFLSLYFSDPIKTLLDDIIIEGFFNNPSYKTQFSSTVYACAEIDGHIKDFEDSFEHGGKNDLALIRSYLKDSHKDQDFTRKLLSMTDSINAEAKKLIENITAGLFTLYSDLGDILADAKKPNSEIISNLKMLTISSRNRDSTDMLETQYVSWTLFFDIMKNYTVIGRTDKGS